MLEETDDGRRSRGGTYVALHGLTEDPSLPSDPQPPQRPPASSATPCLLSDRSLLSRSVGVGVVDVVGPVCLML